MLRVEFTVCAPRNVAELSTDRAIVLVPRRGQLHYSNVADSQLSSESDLQRALTAGQIFAKDNECGELMLETEMPALKLADLWHVRSVRSAFTPHSTRADMFLATILLKLARSTLASKAALRRLVLYCVLPPPCNSLCYGLD